MAVSSSGSNLAEGARGRGDNPESLRRHSACRHRRARKRGGLLALLVAISACSADDAAVVGEGCVPPESRFASAWSVLGTRCIACHSADGVAKHTKLVLASASQTGFEAQNLETLRSVASYEVDGRSVLLVKPTLTIPHSGGQVIVPGSAEYESLAALVASFEQDCAPASGGSGENETLFADTKTLDAGLTFRRASILLAGRIPTDAETARLREDGDAAIEPMVAALLEEPAFTERVMEVLNDRLLTDKYLGGESAVNLLDDETFPNRRWWKDEENTVPEDDKAFADAYANDAVAREPLELVRHVIENDLPFSEIVTADYLMVNPASARVYGVEGQVDFEDPRDPREFRPAKVPGLPHAGVLTSPMLLNRFPTTETNRNRARARLVWDVFLATDVMRIADRPIDPTGIEDHNPTLFNASCSVCHALIDPIAGTFAAWDAAARFRPPEEGWYSDMRPPGFGDEKVPYGQESKGLAWLGQRIAADPRFATAAVRLAYTVLMGERVLELPTAEEAAVTDAATFEARGLAANAQADLLERVATQFVDSGMNFKVAVKALVLSPWFRTIDIELPPGTDDAGARAASLATVGRGRLLTPEELDRKLTSVIGFPWTRGWDDRPVLLDEGTYRLFYGGIDSDAVSKRISSPNGLMAAVQERMANEVSCYSVARDFVSESSERRLFPYVELSYEPEDINGFVIPEAEAAIRENLRYLVERLLGERLADGDPDLEGLFELFHGVWKDGRAAVASDEEEEWLRGECQGRHDPVTGEELPEERRIERDADYTVRAWMAVLSALLADHRFLHD